MDTKSIRCFSCVYEEKSIHGAAKRLYITPQGLSKVIQNLEEELQVQLFRRSSRGVEATKAGKYLYDNSRELFDMLEELELGIRRIQDEKERYGIGFACGVLNFFSFQKITQLSQMYPGIQIRWEEGSNDEIIDKVIGRKLKFGFVIGKPNIENLETQEIFRMEPDVIVYPGHPYYEKEAISIEDLRGQKLITLNEKFQSYHSIAARCRDCGFIPDIVAKTMESHLIYRFVKGKNGIGIDVNIHKDDIYTGDLRRIPLENAFDWIIYVIYRKQKRNDRIMNELIGYFCNNIKK